MVTKQSLFSLLLISLSLLSFEASKSLVSAERTRPASAFRSNPHMFVQAPEDKETPDWRANLLKRRQEGTLATSSRRFLGPAEDESARETPEWMSRLQQKLRDQGGYTAAKLGSYGSTASGNRESRTYEQPPPEWATRRLEARKEQAGEFVDPILNRPSASTRLAPWQEEVGKRSRERRHQEYVRAQPLLDTPLPSTGGSYHEYGRSPARFVDVGDFKPYEDLGTQTLGMDPDQFLAPLEQHAQVMGYDYPSMDARARELYGSDDEYLSW